MRILDLEIKNFRNIEEQKIVPDSRMNVICGENAQGKTNLIEAIWLFTGAKSFRGVKDSEFVFFGKNKALLKMNFIGEQIEKNAEILNDEKKSIFLNEKKLKKSSEIAGSFNAIIFSPLDLRLITDGPSIRRRFLDLAIGQLYPSYIEILRNYLRAIGHRNKTLKDFKFNNSLSSLLDVFEKEIAENGRKIIKFRKRYIEILNEFLPNLYNGLSSGKEILETEYICNSKSEKLEENLKEARKEDMYSGVTSIGPHRDDLEFKINGISARSFASQGQKRSIALCLKLAEAEVLKKNVGEWPVILLDDVMSELDLARQNFVLNHIEGMQSFISCCDPSNVKQLKNGKIFRMKEGRIS